jgi:hypothetical protein
MIIPVVIDNVASGVNNAGVSVVIRGTVPHQSFGNVENWRAFIETEPERKLIPDTKIFLNRGYIDYKKETNSIVIHQEGLNIELPFSHAEQLESTIASLVEMYNSKYPTHLRISR